MIHGLYGIGRKKKEMAQLAYRIKLNYNGTTCHENKACLLREVRYCFNALDKSYLMGMESLAYLGERHFMHKILNYLNSV